MNGQPGQDFLQQALLRSDKSRALGFNGRFGYGNLQGIASEKDESSQWTGGATVASGSHEDASRHYGPGVLEENEIAPYDYGGGVRIGGGGAAPMRGPGSGIVPGALPGDAGRGFGGFPPSPMPGFGGRSGSHGLGPMSPPGPSGDSGRGLGSGGASVPQTPPRRGGSGRRPPAAEPARNPETVPDPSLPGPWIGPQLPGQSRELPPYSHPLLPAESPGPTIAWPAGLPWTLPPAVGPSPRSSLSEAEVRVMEFVTMDEAVQTLLEVITGSRLSTSRVRECCWIDEVDEVKNTTAKGMGFTVRVYICCRIGGRVFRFSIDQAIVVGWVILFPHWTTKGLYKKVHPSSPDKRHRCSFPRLLPPECK